MVSIGGMEIDPALIAIVLFILLFMGTFYFGIESRNRGIIMKRRQENFDLLLNKTIIIEATQIRTRQATPSSHIARLKEVVNLTRSDSENLQDAKLVISQSQVVEKIIVQLGRVVDELEGEKGSNLFSRMSKLGADKLGTLEQYGIASVEDVKTLYIDIKEYYPSEQIQSE